MWAASSWRFIAIKTKMEDGRWRMEKSGGAMPSASFHPPSSLSNQAEGGVFLALIAPSSISTPNTSRTTPHLRLMLMPSEMAWSDCATRSEEHTSELQSRQYL